MTARMTIQALQSLLKYDERSGRLRWKTPQIATRRGCVNDVRAAFLRVRPYPPSGLLAPCETLGGAVYFACDVIWALRTGSWPSHPIEFIDGEPSNTRLHNLRCGDRVAAPDPDLLPHFAKAGSPGVRWHKRDCRWQVLDGKKFIGLYADYDAACAALRAARDQ